MNNDLRLVLQVCLFGPLCLALIYGHGYLALWGSDFVAWFDSRTAERIAILVSALLAGVVAGVIFAYPYLWIYRRSAVVVSGIASVFAAAFRWQMIGKSPHLPLVTVAFVLEVVTLAICLPLCVWLIRNRRDGTSQLVETPCAN